MTNMLMEKSKKYRINNYAPYPITLVKGEGVYVWDDQNKKYLDFLGGIACVPLGHCHPAITKAIIEQAQNLVHTSNLYYTEPSIELAECIVKNGGLNKVFFCNSGAEANEAAIKLARKYQWRQNKLEKNVILSATHSFHGRTLATLAATEKPNIQEGFAPLPGGFKHAEWNNATAFCQAIDETVAAVILEPIQGEGGINVASKEFLQAVRAACDKVGALLIFDEIQCGVGRTGYLFAYQHYGIKPDIITLAKGLANGLPIGATCATEQVAAAFKPGDHGSTFGGNLVSCRAALAVLNTLNKEDYFTVVKERGNYLFAKLQVLQQKYPQNICDVRGIGLMIGIELTSGGGANQVLQYCHEQGLLVNIARESVIRLLPSYLITNEHIDEAVNILDGAVSSVI